MKPQVMCCIKYLTMTFSVGLSAKLMILFPPVLWLKITPTY